MKSINDLEPKKVFKYFAEISSVPRESGKEGKIADYLESFAAKRGLKCTRDEYNNVIIKKPCTKGYEHCPTVILQGHMDMVCVSRPGTSHDFDNDGLCLYLDGDLLRAKDTTLGADNGIALGYGLAALDSDDMEHPALEVVFTTSEETGMQGAKKLNMSPLKGKLMISFDSGGFTEGRIYVGCAGNQSMRIRQRIIYADSSMQGSLCQIRVQGLKGGHSGGEIHKDRANADKCLARILYYLKDKVEYGIVSVCGGDPDNPVKSCIPDKAVAELLAADSNEVQKAVRLFDSIFKDEYAVTDENVEVIFEDYGHAEKRVFDLTTRDALIDFINVAPNGVYTMNKYFTDTPESSDNMGAIEMSPEEITYNVTIRSSKESRIDDLLAKFEILADLFGFRVETYNRLCGWEYNPQSKLKSLMERIYTEKYGQKPRFKVTHASTECGLFKEHIKDLDVISIGPIIYEEHTYNEYMEVVSVKELWDFICQVLRELKDLY